jgi:hypothetical protein
MVGGTFGVAAVGALFQSLSASKLHSKLADLPLTATQKSWFIENLGSGAAASRLHRLPPATGNQVSRALHDTFVSSLSSSMRLSAAVAATGMLIAVLAIEQVRHRAPEPIPDTLRELGRAAPAQPQLPAEPEPS